MKSTARRTGQKGEAQWIVEGADRPERHQPCAADDRPAGGNTIQVRISGGGSNRARIAYRE
jgi:hypothetical protein